VIGFGTIASLHVLQSNLKCRLRSGPHNPKKDQNAQVATLAVNREEASLRNHTVNFVSSTSQLMANATYPIATKMGGVRMALAICEVLHRSNSSLINKEAEKKRKMMKFVLIHAKSRNLRHVDATEDRRSRSSVTIV
jgi:hypothetical protein